MARKKKIDSNKPTKVVKKRKVGRPKSDNPKQLIAVRLSPSLLQNLKRLARKTKKPYQRIMHEMLEKAVKEAA